VLTCPSCGKENPDGFPFCGFCTAPLTHAPAPTFEERKVVTVLFCDLVGFTARSEHADPEDIRGLLRRYHALLKADIEVFDGTVEKFIGDAVMAVFGAPLAHEDDPERAVRAGLRILDSITELNEANPGMNLSVRVGVNTGETLVSLAASPEKGEGMVAGDVVNTAARLQAAAPVNSVVAGDRTHRATRGVFRYEELPPVTAKGKSEPVALWRAISLRRDRELPAPRATKFVGRDAELIQLIDQFDRSVSDSSVHVVTVVGEPGAGKTRLVEELKAFLAEHRDGVIWRRGRCLPYGEGITFWALGEVVKAEAGILESDSTETAGTKLDEVLAEGPDREWIRQRLLPLIGMEAASAATRDESFTAWLRFLESIARRGPAVFVFEDLHWADDAMLDFVEHVAARSEAAPMLVLGPTRPELVDRRPTWMSTARTATTLRLEPLTDEETARLISTFLGEAVLPADLQSLVLERAEGNPLYAEEFVRLLSDRRLLVRKGRTLALAEGFEVPSPESLLGLIAARLDTLSPEHKQLLADAAVIGKVFWAGAVVAMGDRDAMEVVGALQALSARELVRPAAVSSMEGESEYSFWHALVRDVAYAQIPRAARAQKHRKAASWIKSASEDRLEDVAEVLAHHYTLALGLALAAGQKREATDIEPLATRFLVMAGDRALGLDVGRAVAHYGRALELAPPGHPERAVILARWADAVRQTGRIRDAAEGLEEAVASFRQRGDVLGTARTMLTLTEVLRAMADPKCWKIGPQAVTLLEAEGPSPDLVAAYANLASGRMLAGHDREAIELADRAISLAAALGLEEPVKALGSRGSARCDLGEAEGLADLRRAVTLAVERGQGREAAVHYNNLGVSLWPIEGPSAYLMALREGIEFSERRGIVEFVEAMTVGSMEPLFDLGSWDQLLEVARRSDSTFEAAGSTLLLVEVRGMQARVLGLQGRTVEALPLVEWAVQTARESGEREYIGGTFSSAAPIHVAMGEPDRALDLLAEVEGLAHIGEAVTYAAYLPAMVRTAVAGGDVALAERLASRIASLYPYQQHALCAVRAVISEAKGDTELAAQLYAEGASRWERFGVVPELAFALLGQGRCLVALDLPEAAEVLRAARVIFAQLSAKPALAEADALLQRRTAVSS
jgi:class 3 adenylate cyclase/tetratricopeptide (TPR) repeat protein